MTRLSTLVLLASTALFATPSLASAQFVRPYGTPYGYGLTAGVPRIVPSTNPFYYVPHYSYGRTYAASAFGLTVTYSRYASGTGFPSVSADAGPIAFPQVTTYGAGGSVMSAGTGLAADYVLRARRNLERAQREAAAPGVSASRAGVGRYEKPPAAPEPPPGPPEFALPDAIRGAVASADPERINSGEALNALLKEISSLEAKELRGPSAYISPLQVDDVRFGGSPAADLFTLTRLGASRMIPPAFDGADLAGPRVELARDFEAVAKVVRKGKSPDPREVKKLEESFEEFRSAARSALNSLAEPDAAAARRFIEQMAGAVKALNAGSAGGLVEPKWAAEGLTVSDLTRHMARYKLEFGPAPKGADQSYTALHRNLATYLFVLKQTQK